MDGRMDRRMDGWRFMLTSMDAASVSLDW